MFSISSLGSRRLITYRRLPEGVLSDVSSGRRKDDAAGVSADDLNAFRRIVCPPFPTLTSLLGECPNPFKSIS
jgi:tRNA (guanine10-N2)-methyltransferase